MKRKPLSPREHMVLGKRLNELEDELENMVFMLQTAYESGLVAKAIKVTKVIKELRCSLSVKSDRETPRGIDFIDDVPVVQFYYWWSQGQTRVFAPHDGVKLRAELAEKADRLFDGGNPWDAASPSKPLSS